MEDHTLDGLLCSQLIDGFDNTPLFSLASGWIEPATHYTLSRHIYQPAVVVVNLEWFNGLPADVQALLLKPARAIEGAGRKLVRVVGPELIKSFTDVHKVKVYKLTEAERAAFKKLTRPVWDSRRKAAGALGKKLVDAILAAKKKG